MKVKVSELIGPALDWAVAKCEGVDVEGRGILRTNTSTDGGNDWVPYAPSQVLSQGGSIIEREGVDLRQLKQQTHETIEMRHFDSSKGDEVYRPPGWKRDMVRRPIPPHPMHTKWLARMSKGTDCTVHWSKSDFLSDTMLVAAMRCYVSSKLGNEVEVPDDLVKAPE